MCVHIDPKKKQVNQVNTDSNCERLLTVPLLSCARSIRARITSLSIFPLSEVAANRVGRWNMLLSEFQFEFSYIEGSKNHLADSLSRVVEFPPSAWTVVFGWLARSLVGVCLQ